jgi:hypothetical protein
MLVLFFGSHRHKTVYAIRTASGGVKLGEYDLVLIHTSGTEDTLVT